MAQDCCEEGRKHDNSGRTVFLLYLYDSKGVRREEIISYHNSKSDCENALRKYPFKHDSDVRIICKECSSNNDRSSSNNSQSSFNYSDIMSRVSESRENADRINRENTTSRYFNPGEVKVIESSAAKDAESEKVSNAPIPKPVNRKLKTMN